MPMTLNRRHIIAGLPALLADFRATHAHAEPPPEVTSVRLPVYYNLSDCQTPLYIAAALLNGEGITDVQWVGFGGNDGMSTASAESVVLRRFSITDLGRGRSATGSSPSNG